MVAWVLIIARGAAPSACASGEGRATLFLQFMIAFPNLISFPNINVRAVFLRPYVKQRAPRRRFPEQKARVPRATLDLLRGFGGGCQ